MSLLSSPVAVKRRGRKRKSVLVEKNTVKKKTWEMWAQRSITEIGILGQEEKICIGNKQNFVIFPYTNFWHRRVILLAVGKFGLFFSF